MADEYDEPITPAVEDPDLADILGPPPSREIQEAARKQVLGPSRLVARNPGSGRVPGGKCTPERMWRIIKSMEQLPIPAKACRFANIHPATLQLWLEKSMRGSTGDVFSLVINPEDPPEEQITKRFHELYDFALESGVDAVEEAAMKRAIGYEEVLTYQGRVQYRLDPVLVDLGFTGSEAWLKDDRGQPIPETVLKQDPDLIQFILKNRRAKIYGTKVDVGMRVTGGVLVVAAKALTSNELVEESKKYLEAPIDVEFEEVDEAAEDDGN